MKKLILLPLLIFIVGCVSSKIPKYLKDEVAYTQKFYKDYDTTLSATQDVINEFGWEVTEMSNPAIYDQGFAVVQPGQKQVLIFTSVRQTPLFVGTRYARMNVLVKGLADASTEVEIRYLTVNSTPVRSMESYNNESAAKRIFKRISEILETK